MLYKGTFSHLDLFGQSSSNYKMAIDEISAILPIFTKILQDSGLEINHNSVKENLRLFNLETHRFPHVLEHMSKRVTSFRETTIDKMTEELNTITPLTSPNPSGSNSIKTSKSSNQLTRDICLNHLPKEFYNCLKKHDFTDIEILAIYDSKILEAGMIYWLKVKKSSNFVEQPQEPTTWEETQNNFMESVISVLCLVDEEMVLKGGGVQAAEESEEAFPEKEDEEIQFTSEVCKSIHIPVFLIRKINEEYNTYIHRITKFLNVNIFLFKLFFSNQNRALIQRDSA